MNKKIKILFLVGNFRTGGKERQLTELLKNISPEIFQIKLVIKNLSTHYLDEIKSSLDYEILNHNKFSFSSFLTLNKIINKFKPDIVHSWSDIFSFFCVFLKFKNRYILVDGSIRDANPPKNIDYLIRKIINFFSDTIIANSNAGLIAHGAPKNKSICIYNGFDFFRTDKSIKNTKIGYEIKTKHIVTMIGRVGNQKDFKSYIKMACLTLQKNKNITFLIIGDGDELIEIKNLVPKHLFNHFIFTGNIQNVESYIKITDVGILLTYTEGVPNTLMEFMSFQKPVIASDSGGINELILDNISGYIVPVGDYNTASEKLTYLLNNKTLRDRFGAKGREIISSKFSLNTMINKYQNLYLKYIK